MPCCIIFSSRHTIILFDFTCFKIASTVTLQNQVSAEVGSLINMSALAVSQLLESAQEKGIELNLETSAVENQVQTMRQNSIHFLFYHMVSIIKSNLI